MNDVAAIADLQRAFDIYWFGASEHSEDEVREFLGWVDSLADESLVLIESGELQAVALNWTKDTALLVHPQVEPEPHYAQLLPWFADRNAHVECLSRDDRLVATLRASGWTFRKSSFDLIRAVSPELQIPPPRWPNGIETREFDPADAPAIHHLIYVDAGWAEVPGHPERDLDEWRGFFVGEHTVPAQQVVAWRDQRIVGVAMCRMWDDGTGWVSQLASAKDERGKGLGRALLAEALRRQIAAGASSLGLSVQATNEGALRMYLDAGLQIDREWQQFTPPG